MSRKMPKLYFIQIDNTIEAFDSESRPVIEEKARKALSRGLVVIWEDKTTEWLEFYQRIDLAKTGSARYTWDKRGDKVLADVFKVTRLQTGETSRQKMGTRYIEL